MVRYPFDTFTVLSDVEGLTMIGRPVRPEVYPPSAAPEATRVSKDERGERDLLRIHQSPVNE